MNFKNLVDDNALLYFFSKLKTMFASKDEVQNVAERVDSIASEGGEPNKIEVVKVNSIVQAVNNKEVDIETVTQTDINSAVQASQRQQAQSLMEIYNELNTSLASKRDESQVQEQINTALADFTGIDFQIVDSLPTNGTKGTIYLVSNGGVNGNSYDEYIYFDSKFEKIGTTDIDLSGYIAKEELTIITNQQIDTIVAG